MKQLIFPESISPKSGRAVIIPSAKTEKNQFTGAMTVYDNGTDFWRQKMVIGLLKGDEADDLDSFLVELRGAVNGVWLKDYNYISKGSWAGNVVVDGADNEGTQLNVRGATANSTFAYKGDRFQYGIRMHQLIEDATANGSGKTTLKFEPQLTSIPSDGDSIETDNPMTLYRWMNPTSRPQLDRHRRVIKGADLMFEEAR